MPEPPGDIVFELESSRRVFEQALDGVSETRARINGAPGAWSILEVTEHLALAERGLLRLFGTRKPAGTSLENREREAELALRLTNRASRAQAPERVRPGARFATLEAALRAFLAAREETIRFANDHGSELYRCTVEHPLFGGVNGVEHLVIISGHARRHAAQIQEIRRSIRDMALPE